MSEKTRDDRWRIWDGSAEYGEVLRKRALGELPEMECARATARRVAPLLGPGTTLLDVGCGAGHYLRSLRALGVPFRYRGVDATVAYVELARRAFAGDPAASFDVGDVSALPYADGAFDVVVCSNLLLHVPTLKRPLLELARVARRALLVRTLVGERSFVVQEVRAAPGAEPSLEGGHGFDADGSPAGYCYYNIYAEAYVRSLLAACPGVRAVAVEPDRDFDPELLRANRAAGLPTGAVTDATGGLQRLGYLLLPWAFVRVDKEP